MVRPYLREAAAGRHTEHEHRDTGELHSGERGGRLTGADWRAAETPRRSWTPAPLRVDQSHSRRRRRRRSATAAAAAAQSRRRHRPVSEAAHSRPDRVANKLIEATVHGEPEANLIISHHPATVIPTDLNGGRMEILVFFFFAKNSCKWQRIVATLVAFSTLEIISFKHTRQLARCHARSTSYDVICQVMLLVLTS